MKTPDVNGPQNPSETGMDDRQPAAESGVAVKNAAPQGVIRPNLKLYVMLGAVVLLLMASAISSLRNQPVKPKPSPTVPFVQEPDSSRISDFSKTLKHEIAEQQQQAAENGTAAASQAQNALGSQTMNSGTAQPLGSGNGTSQNPAEQQREALAEQERDIAFKSRFASNLAYSASRQQSASQPVQQFNANAPNGVPPFRPDQQNAQQKQNAQNRPAEVTVNSAVGQPYVLYEGTIIDTVLMNRLDGDEAGPVKVLVTDPVYSRDRQHVLIPEGSVILGESRKIGNAGFGQQRRVALVFHRLLMPDGFSVDLDRFQGLNQIGEGGIKDKVNNHYLEIFGASIALGIVSAAAESSTGNAGAFASGTDSLKAGVAASLSQSATNILDKFLNIPATITIREGHRIKVYLSQDLLLPAAENHTIPPNI
jgi:type IV secretory pathway VirB10-like protein